jgi:catalase
MTQQNQVNGNSKNEDLESCRKEAGDQLTTDHGVKIDDTDNWLKVGSRGSSLHEDFQVHPI